jgi:hypothetical protein
MNPVTVRVELMAIGLGRCLVLGLARSVVVAQGGAGGEGVEGVASQLDEVAPGDLPSSDLVGNPGLPPLPMRPETRDGFLIRKAVDYGVAPADFDGDGRDDVAQTNGDGWRMSRGASTAWAALRGSGGQPQYKDITAVLVGRFGPDERDDALRYELVRTLNGFKTGVRFVGWDGTQDAFVQWSPQYVR